MTTFQDRTFWQHVSFVSEKFWGYLTDPERQEQLLKYTWQHLELAILAVLLAFAAGVLMSLTAWGRPKSELAIHSVANLFQTIPALALLAILFTLFRSSFWPAVLTIALYAVLPIVKSFATALAETREDMLEVGRSMGMSSWQILWHIQLPQGLPLIVSGLRIAFVYSIGSATLAAFVGAGGLGQYIYQGLALNNSAMVLLGAIPVALLAIVIDLLLGLVEKKALAWKNGRPFLSPATP